MANQFHTYFGQIITDTELNDIFDALFASVDRFVQDFGFRGIAVGGDVTQHTPLNLSVDVGAPTVVYDQFANRMEFGSLVNVHVNVDENGAATAVAGSSNEKWLSVFIQFTSTPADPRTDDLGNTVYFEDVTSYKLNVVQGAEAPTGTAARPALRGDQILLADVKLAYGATTIANAAISSDRAEVIYNLSGSPLAVRGKDLSDVLQAMVDTINNVIATTTGAIGAITADPLATAAVSGSPVSLASGTVHSSLVALIAAINSLWSATAHYLIDSGNNTITQSDASIALLGTNSVPADDAYFVGGAHNRWKLIFFFKHAGGSYVKVYTGQNVSDAAGAYVITTNATWDVPSQKWQQISIASPSVALVWFFGRLRVATKLAGAADWSSWDQTIDGALEVGSISVVGEVKYPSNKSRTSILPPSAAAVANGSVAYTAGRLTTVGTDTVLTWVLRLPAGATISECTVLTTQASSTSPVMQALKGSAFNFESPAAPTLTVVASDTGDSSTGAKTQTVDFGGLTASDGETYEVTWHSLANGDKVHGLQVNWSDPGPVSVLR